MFEEGIAGLAALREVLQEGLGIGWFESGPILREVLSKGRRTAEVVAVVDYLASLGLERDDGIRSLARFHPWVLALAMDDLQVRQPPQMHGLRACNSPSASMKRTPSSDPLLLGGLQRPTPL